MRTACGGSLPPSLGKASTRSPIHLLVQGGDTFGSFSSLTTGMADLDSTLNTGAKIPTLGTSTVLEILTLKSVD